MEKRLLALIMSILCLSLLAVGSVNEAIVL